MCLYYKNKKGIVIYHVPSKRRIILDEKYTAVRENQH